MPQRIGPHGRLMTLQFDHWPFIAAAYGIFLAIAVWLSIGAGLRLKRAGAKLRAVDPRNKEGK